jgi:putative transcriptional regulator
MNSSNLLGSCLVAMPGVDDRYFQSSLICITHVDDSVVQGIIVNKPTDQKLSKVINQMNMTVSRLFQDQKIMVGGPLHRDRLFLMYMSNDNFVFSSDYKDLQYMVNSEISNDYIAAIGMCEWVYSDLIKQIESNQWLIINMHRELLIKSHYSDRLGLVLSRLGIGIEQISSESGHA